jgi:hypothetical protein
MHNNVELGPPVVNNNLNNNPPISNRVMHNNLTIIQPVVNLTIDNIYENEYQQSILQKINHPNTNNLSNDMRQNIREIACKIVDLNKQLIAFKLPALIIKSSSCDDVTKDAKRWVVALHNTIINDSMTGFDEYLKKEIDKMIYETQEKLKKW